MDLEREKVCCFTGHRPAGLPFGNDEESPNAERLKKAIRNELVEKIEGGCCTFITGCAQGADIICGELVLRLKEEKYPNIRLICAVPYRGQAERWSNEWRDRHEALMSAADEIVEVCPQYTKSCFHQRNRYMVDRSTDVIAVYNGEEHGGTAYTIKYALEKQKRVDIFNVQRWVICRKNG